MESKHKKELDRLRAEYEKNLLKLRDVALEKEKIIATLKKEMARFERMPNTPGGRLMQSGDQQKPDAMPSQGGYTTEGLVLSRPKNQGKFAVFFYNYKAVSSGSSVGGSSRGGRSIGGKSNGTKTSGKPGSSEPSTRQAYTRSAAATISGWPSPSRSATAGVPTT